MNYSSGSCCYGDNSYKPSQFSYRPGPMPAYAGKDYSPPQSGSIDSIADESVNLLTVSVPEVKYMPQQYSKLYLSNRHQDYFVLDPFLTHEVPTDFVNDAKMLEEPTRQAFRETTKGKELPKNISIHLMSETELRKAHEVHSGRWSPGIQGFSINRGLQGVSEVFVKKDYLDRVMVTLGHELGHVISPTLPDARDEEAKAFAFSMAWMRAIVDNNIAGLTNAINPLPAKNGLHDVGFDFVQDQVAQKKSAFDVFRELAEGMISITKTVMF